MGTRFYYQVSSTVKISGSAQFFVSTRIFDLCCNITDQKWIDFLPFFSLYSMPILIIFVQLLKFIELAYPVLKVIKMCLIEATQTRLFKFVAVVGKSPIKRLSFGRGELDILLEMFPTFSFVLVDDAFD